VTRKARTARKTVIVVAVMGIPNEEDKGERV
jgi:hypothetical protein